MVKIRKRKKFYYLEHSIRVENKIIKKEIYLGKTIPKDIEKIKHSFFHEIFKDKYFADLNKIKKNFKNEFSSLPKTAKDKYIENFMIKFTYDTNRIEGSTLTLKDTANLLKDGISPSNRPIKDIKETESHRKLFYKILEHNDDLNLNTILHWHKVLLKDTNEDIAGKVRTHQVAISGSDVELPFPAELNILLKEFFSWYNKVKNKLHTVELAALVHLRFVSVHPFSDGNGRISRILMNFVLKKNRYPMLNIHYSNRASYYTALERSQKSGNEYIFVQYLIKRYIKEYRRYL